MSGVLIDTSVLIASAENGLDLADDSAISVITVGELHAGVNLARSPEIRNARQARLRRIMGVFAPIPVDEPVAIEYGRLLAFARSTGRVQKATDLLIAATAATTGRTLWTRDESQASLGREAGLVVNLV